MAAIVRVAIVAITLALLAGSALNAFSGHRDLSVVFALAAPLGISAWGFARGGHHEAALVLLCVVLTMVTTLVLVLSPYGAHDVAMTAYGGVVLTGALLLSRRAFFALASLTFVGACVAFMIDILGLSQNPAHPADWAQLVEFVVIIGVFAGLGRYASEVLMGSLGDAQRASTADALTGLLNRKGFIAEASARMKSLHGGSSVLVLADLDDFRRVNAVIGHRAGDAILGETARRLKDAMNGHVVARLGDDEFVVFGHDLKSDAECDAFARDVHRALQFEYSGVSVRASVGYARAPRDANGLDALMIAAEASLKSAKDHERENERFAAPAERI